MKVLISTPSYQHQVNNEMVHSLLRTVQYMRENNHSVNWHSPTSSQLTFNRNIAVDIAMREHYDWLLFWDADISVAEPDFIEKMAQLGHKTTANVVGLPVVMKGEPKTYNCATRGDVGQYTNYTEIPREPWQVDVIGTGVMLIWVNDLRQMDKPVFKFIDTWDPKRGAGVFPEDWRFCERATVGGAKRHPTIIMADPRFTVEHWGLKPFA